MAFDLGIAKVNALRLVDIPPEGAITAQYNANTNSEDQRISRLTTAINDV
jgi:hypothetical protein